MIKNIIIAILFITSLFSGSSLSIVIKDNKKIGTENYELKEDIERHRELIQASTEELRDCKIERNEYRTYVGEYELKVRKSYYHTGASLEEILKTTE